MKNTQQLIREFQECRYDDLLVDIYADRERIAYENDRYIQIIQEYEKHFGGCGQVGIFSAPGRSEIGGNHTDHQHGEVLAAAINRDALAVAGIIEEPEVRIWSEGYGEIRILLDELDKKEEEEGTTAALVRGVLAGTKRERTFGGFRACVTSDVLSGAGLSSSAAFETLIGTIVSGLYFDSSLDAVKIAMIGQYAENVYFGKPCGLMDQMACSIGSLVHIDFADPQKPLVSQVSCNLDRYGYSLCITDTKGSHADLTEDYAAIPDEMKQISACFGKEVLREVSKKDLLEHMNQIREQAGDRAVLRAIHFVEENERVQKEVAALQKDDFARFLELVQESGNSSFKYLQNVYSNHDVEQQSVSIALAISDSVLGKKGVSRVHGGGFAGTIQAFVQNEAVADYKRAMDMIFGPSSCNVLKIRKYGGMKVL